MITKKFAGGPAATNSWLVADSPSKTAFVFDVAKDTWANVAAEAKRLGVKVGAIINSHGHWDHIAEDAQLKKATGAKVEIHALDKPLLLSPTWYFEQPLFHIEPVQPDVLLKEGDSVKLGSATFSVLHLPGHTPGSIALHSPELRLLLSGDVLFQGSNGRTDLTGGDDAAMNVSLKRLASLDRETRVLPGHGAETKIENELPWLNQL